eukprot:scaffold40518_cov107-Phaeocystis_antarctica.AAC.3
MFVAKCPRLIGRLKGRHRALRQSRRRARFAYVLAVMQRPCALCPSPKMSERVWQPTRPRCLQAPLLQKETSAHRVASHSRLPCLWVCCDCGGTERPCPACGRWRHC